MHRNTLIRIAATITVLVFSLATTSQAQERRVGPAFPIASGERMLVIPGKVFLSGELSTLSTSYVSSTDIDTNYYYVPLPVGTTLKRLIADMSDNDGVNSAYIIMSLLRVQNGVTESITLRSVNTENYNSAVIKQFTSYPMDHQILQGWTYFLRITINGGSPHSSHRISVIKIIYEP